jgi:hypothetical protein
MIQRTFFIAFSVVFLVGCVGKQRKVRRTMDCPNPMLELNEVKAATDSIQRDFKFLKLKGDLKVTQEEKAIGFSAQIRMEKDVAVWVSLKKLGFPVLKMKFTQDSVLIVNTFEQKYFAGTYEYAASRIDADVNFNIIQGALLSKAQWSDAYNELWHTSTQYVAASHRKKVITNFHSGQTGMLERALVQWINCNTLLLDQMNIYDPKEDANVWVWSSDPDSSAGFWMNRRVKLEVKKEGKEVLKMDIELDDIETRDDLSLPLSIPEGYEKMQL